MSTTGWGAWGAPFKYGGECMFNPFLCIQFVLLHPPPICFCNIPNPPFHLFSGFQYNVLVYIYHHFLFGIDAEFLCTNLLFSYRYM